MDEMIKRLRNLAWAAGEVADYMERGQIDIAKSAAALVDIPDEFYREILAIEGQEELNYEHREAVERRTA